MRVLIAGPPNHPSPELVAEALGRVFTNAVEVLGRDVALRVFQLVTGGAHRGVDKFTDQWVWQRSRVGLVLPQPETHPVNWEAECRDRCQAGHRVQRTSRITTCPTAALYRNEEMVELGADLCLCFPVDDSAGSRHCGIYAKLCAECRPRGTKRHSLAGPPGECPSCNGPAGIETVTHVLASAVLR